MNELILPVLLSSLFVMIAEGVGSFLISILHIEKRGFAAPLGTAIVFSVLEVLYLPILFFQLSANIATIVTFVAFLATIVITLYELKEVLHTLWQRDTIAILLSIVLYILIFMCSSDLSIGSAELSFVSSNSYAAKVSFLSNPLQGYQMLQAVLLRYMTKKQLLLMLGSFYHIIFGAVSLNIIRTLNLKNQWFSFTLVIYALFYTAFNSWQIARAGAGANFRVVFIALILWQIYCWLKDQNEAEKYTLLFYMTAGCFISGGFAIISFEILYALAIYLFSIKKKRSLFDLTTLLIPYACYYCVVLAEVNWIAAIILLGLIILFIVMRYRPKLRRMIWRAEDYLFDYGRLILLVIIPITVMVISVILEFLPFDILVPFSFYRQFVSVQPTRSYLFLDHRVMTWILDLFRWGGLVILIWKGKNDEEVMLKNLFLIMIVLFLNPLSMGLVSRFVGIDVYAYTFEILFNPFTDLLLFVTIYHVFEWQVIGQWVLEIFLIAACLIGHVGSFVGSSQGLYTDFVNDVEASEVVQ